MEYGGATRPVQARRTLGPAATHLHVLRRRVACTPAAQVPDPPHAPLLLLGFGPRIVMVLRARPLDRHSRAMANNDGMFPGVLSPVDSSPWNPPLFLFGHGEEKEDPGLEESTSSSAVSPYSPFTSTTALFPPATPHHTSTEPKHTRRIPAQTQPPQDPTGPSGTS